MLVQLVCTYLRMNRMHAIKITTEAMVSLNDPGIVSIYQVCDRKTKKHSQNLFIRIIWHI